MSWWYDSVLPFVLDRSRKSCLDCQKPYSESLRVGGTENMALENLTPIPFINEQ